MLVLVQNLPPDLIRDFIDEDQTARIKCRLALPPETQELALDSMRTGRSALQEFHDAGQLERNHRVVGKAEVTSPAARRPRYPSVPIQRNLPVAATLRLQLFWLPCRNVGAKIKCLKRWRSGAEFEPPYADLQIAAVAPKIMRSLK